MAITARGRRAAISKAGSADQFIQGMDAASELIGFLQGLGSDIAGCILPAKRRDGGGNNADLVEWLANPRSGPERDIRPTQEDHDEAAKIIKETILAKLQMISKTGKRYKRWDEAKSRAFIEKGSRQANALLAMALRRAGAAMKARMMDRVNSGGYAEVGEKYAARRQAKYGVPPGAVFKATGQLLSNITDGHVRLVRKTELRKILGGYAEEIASMITG